MVGTVVEAGAGAALYDISVGDRVCAVDLKLGGNARYVFINSYQLIKVCCYFGKFFFQLSN